MEAQLNEAQLISELLREVSEINKHFRTVFGSSNSLTGKGSAYSLRPAEIIRPDMYQRTMLLISYIKEVLDESGISIKSRGYSYIVDAVCIITDLGTFNVCLNTDVYPQIAARYGISSISVIEHSIRNAINSAYNKFSDSDQDDIPPSFQTLNKPTSKRFILYVTQEVHGRLLNQI